MADTDVSYATCTFDQPQPGCTVIRIGGELDAWSATHVQEEITTHLPQERSRIVLDLEQVSFIDSTGIRLLMQVVGRRQSPEQAVVVTPKAVAARRALEVVGLPRVVRVVDTVDEALAA